MNYTEKEIHEIQNLICKLCGEHVTVQRAIEAYEEMVDSDDISESHFYKKIRTAKLIAILYYICLYPFTIYPCNNVVHIYQHRN